ncbi:MAG: hypothetical protein PHF23_06965 [Smithellaceae bacterium]|jgi:hypothetical protein|nr:hypothetical protein [Smithellaceae bacterium]
MIKFFPGSYAGPTGGRLNKQLYYALHAFGFADAVPDQAADGAIDFFAFLFCQVQRIKNDVVQLRPVGPQG